MLERVNRYAPLLICIAMFFSAQLYYWHTHFGFGSTFHGPITQVGTDFPAGVFFKEHFFQSLFYYHLLPPLYTAYAYGTNILFPPNGQIGIYILHSILGVLGIASMLCILRRLGVNTYISLFAIAFYVFGLSFNLFESMGWYDFPTAMLLLISTKLLIKFSDKRTIRNSFYFFSSIAILSLVRSMYHIAIYFVPLILMSLLVFSKNKKQVLIGCAIPFLFVFSFYAKNYYLYDVFSINSYSGENLANIATQWNLTLDQRYDGIKKGFFSDLILCPQSPDTIPTKLDNFAYTGYECYDQNAQKYRDAYINKLGKTYKDVPLLQPIAGYVHPHRSILGNIGMDIEYQKNAVAAIIHYPSVYFGNFSEALRLYFTDTISYFYQNMGNIRHLPVIHYTPASHILIKNAVFFPWMIFFAISCLCLSTREGIVISNAVYLAIAIPLTLFFQRHGFVGYSQFKVIDANLFVLLMGSVFCIPYRYLKDDRGEFYFDETQKRTIFFILLNIIFASLVFTMLTGNEQQRYRFYLEAFYIILAALFFNTALFPKNDEFE